MLFLKLIEKMKTKPAAMILTGFIFFVVFQTRASTISITQELPPPSPPAWTLSDKLTESDDELMKVPVAIGSKELPYYESRFVQRNNSIQVSRRRFTDKERTIGFKLLNLKTGAISVISVSTKITPDGVNLVTPPGYNIDIITRDNGIRWNYWNTLYKVNEPADTIVIKNNFPREETITTSKIVKNKKGRPMKIAQSRRLVAGFLYSPYSDDLLKDEFVAAGSGHIKSVVSQAFQLLQDKGVSIDTETLSQRFFERLPLLEQGDMTEFRIDEQKTVQRVLVIIGINGAEAFKPTCNRAKACGWIQFTPKTYANIRRANPGAQLMQDFKMGAGDHINSMMAAILLWNTNLNTLVKNYGEGIKHDPRLGEYLAAMYNGAPKWTTKSLNATLLKAVDDWTKYLRSETLGFIDKWRYLEDNNLP